MDPKAFRREFRKNQTGAESRLWSVLRNRQLDGRKFRRQHTIGRFTVDFFCFEEKMVIELDGESHDNVSQVIYDQKRDSFFEKEGLKVIRFTNKEVYFDLNEVLNEIKQNLNTSPLPSPQGVGRG